MPAKLGEMSKETVLSRIEADLQRGDLGKARDRLHTLVYNYPSDMALRARLADVYHRLQFPAMAGRYWYLEEHRTPEMETVIAAFERSCGNDPLLMLSAIKFRGDPYQVGDYTRQRLGMLQQAVQDKYGFFPEAYAPSMMLKGRRGAMPKQVRETAYRQMLRSVPPRRGFIQHGLIVIGRHHIDLRVAVAGIVIMALAATGLVSIVWRAYQAFR